MRNQNNIAVFFALLLCRTQRFGFSWTQTRIPMSKVPSGALRGKMLSRFSRCDDPDRRENENEMIDVSKQQFVSESSSRRRWLQSISSAVLVTASTTGFWSFSSAPSKAADVITSQSVCDPTVSVWKKDGRIVYLLGTAHISSASAALAGQLVRDTTPNGVFVELDPKRIGGAGILAQKVGDNSVTSESPQKKSRIIVPDIQATDNPSLTASPSQLLASRASSTSPTNSLTAAGANKPKTKENDNNPIMQAASAAVGKSIKGMYKRLDSAGFESGEEFIVAIKEGRKLGSDIVLGDRDIEITLRRLTEGLAKTDLKVLLSPDSELEQSLQELVPSNMQARIGAASSNGADKDAMDLSDEEFRKEFSSFVESMKTKDNVRKIMGQLQRIAPFLYDALVSERDAYMAAGLNGLNELETIVAVVGIAHADGIEKNLELNGWKAANPSCSKYL